MIFFALQEECENPEEMHSILRKKEENGDNVSKEHKPSRLELLARAITNANKNQDPFVKAVTKHLPGNTILFLFV